ncbi:MAG: imidazole glycerol phosphate synthase subunit HisH [Pseudomonadota bacterium]
MKTIALIDYGSGNLHSAGRALRVAANNAKKTREIKATADPEAIAYADRIVLPGVGHFADCISNLRSRDGLVEALEEAVLKRGVPFLGICVGMQLLAEQGEEDGITPGLGWLPGTVSEIQPTGDLVVPHMGWNELKPTQDHALLQHLPDNAHAYFVHSYAMTRCLDDYVLARTDYGGAINAIIGKDNIAGTQFHPEKSQAVGLQLLSNFVLWNP